MKERVRESFDILSHGALGRCLRWRCRCNRACRLHHHHGYWFFYLARAAARVADGARRGAHARWRPKAVEGAGAWSRRRGAGSRIAADSGVPPVRLPFFDERVCARRGSTPRPRRHAKRPARPARPSAQFAPGDGDPFAERARLDLVSAVCAVLGCWRCVSEIIGFRVSACPRPASLWRCRENACVSSARCATPRHSANSVVWAGISGTPLPPPAPAGGKAGRCGGEATL